MGLFRKSLPPPVDPYTPGLPDSYTDIPFYDLGYGGFALGVGGSNAATRVLNQPIESLWDGDTEHGLTPNFGEGLPYDPFMPNIEFENFLASDPFRHQGDWAGGSSGPSYDAYEVRPQADIGGVPGSNRYRLQQSDEGGVVDWEDFDLVGRVVSVPSSMLYYTKSDGPVGTRTFGEEVGTAVMADGYDNNPDPFVSREEFVLGI